MSAYVISLGAVCAGGNHVTVNVNKDGGGLKAFQFSADDLVAANQDDLQTTLKTILQIHFAGQTKAQAKSALQAGFTVTI